MSASTMHCLNGFSYLFRVKVKACSGDCSFIILLKFIFVFMLKVFQNNKPLNNDFNSQHQVEDLTIGTVVLFKADFIQRR